MNFLDLGLSEETVRAIRECGIEEPTTVQTDVIPAILQGKDIFTIAPGGCGKTMSYVLPLIDIMYREKSRNILIMASDAEKSAVISDNLAMFNRFHADNEKEDGKDGDEADVIIGSPDLLLELAEEKQVDFAKIDILVVDDINLIKKNKQIKNMETILEMLPAAKQNIVYTNRRSKEMQGILDKILKAPEEIKVNKTKEQEAKKAVAAPAKHKNERCQQQATDAEALELVNKYHTFGDKTPRFLLQKAEIAEDKE